MAQLQVQQFGGNTYFINDGATARAWTDVDNDGVVSKGDTIAYFNRAAASVMTYTVGSGETLVTWGDPHISNGLFAAGGEAAFISAQGAMWADVKQDGKLDDANLMVAADQAYKANVVEKHFVDFHGDGKVVTTNGTVIEHDVTVFMNKGKEVAVTAHLDYVFTDSDGIAREVTVRNLSNWQPGVSEMTIQETTGDMAAQAITGDVVAMYEMRGANVGYADCCLAGEDAGTKPTDSIINTKGEAVVLPGRFSSEVHQLVESYRLGNKPEIVRFALALAALDDKGGDSEPDANEVQPQSVPAATISA